METVIDFLTQWQGELITAVAVVGAKYVPAGWNATLRQTARFADWYADMVNAILDEVPNE